MERTNIIILTFYIIISTIIYPLEAIGYSTYSAKIITSVKKNLIDKNLIVMLIIKICAIFFITRCLYYSKYYLEIEVNTRITEHYRNNLTKRIMKKYEEKIKELKLGNLLSKVTSVPHIYNKMFRYLFDSIIPYGLSIIVLLFYFFYIDIRLGSIVFALLASLGLCTLLLYRRCVKYAINNFDDYCKINENLVDKLANFSDILINNQINNELSDNAIKEKEYRKSSFDAEYCDWKLEMALNIILFVFFGLTLYLYYKLFTTKSNNKNKVYLISSFLVYFYLIDYIDSFKWDFYKFIQKKFIINHLNTLLQNNGSRSEHSMIELDGKNINFINNGLIQFTNVFFKYGNKTIHKNLNCTFYPNKINGLFGKSGIGKTTISKLILGLYPISKGNGYITIDNVNISSVNLEYLRDNISYMSQDQKIFNDTILYNIKYGNNITYEQIMYKLKKYNLMTNLNLNRIVGVNGSNLSKGEKKLVLIIRTFLRNKKIIILDEPFTALNNELVGKILNILNIEKKNKTIIVISHNYNIVKKFDHIIRL